MKQAIKLGLILAVAVALLPAGVATANPSADDVIAKYIDAIGGKAALEGITSRKVTGTVSIVDMGLIMPMENYVSGDNFYSKTDVEAMGGMVLSGIKDGVVWQSHFMNGDAVLEGEQAMDVQRQAALSPYLNASDWFSSLEVTGEADVDGEGAYVVEQTPTAGANSTAYFSKDSGLLLKVEGVGGDGMPFTQLVKDYRDVGGVKIPFNMELQGMMTMAITLDSVEVNVDIPAEQFDYPDVIAAMLAPAEEEGSEEKSEEGSDEK